MPRTRIARISVSSEHSSNSDQNDVHNVTDDLPDPGLPKSNCKDAKDKKKVSFNFPCEVITKSGKFPGMGTVDLTEELPSTGKQLRPRKTKAELKEFGTHVEDLTQDEKQPIAKKNNGKKKTNNTGVTKRDKKKEARDLKEAQKKEAEAKKQTLKQDLEKEKVTKKIIEEHNKVYKPEECMKYITVRMHPEQMSAGYMEATVRGVTALGASLQPDLRVGRGLLQWSRALPPTLKNNNGEVQVVAGERCGRSLCVLPAERLASLGSSLAGVAAAVRALAGDSLTLLVLGFNSLYRKLPHSGTQSTKKKLAKLIGDLQIDMMMTSRMELIAVETPDELAALVSYYTKAVAEAPYKIGKRDIEEEAEFYMRGDNKNCVTVDKDGNGLSRLWEQMLAVLPQASLEVARSLGAEYKDPDALTQELLSPPGVKKMANLGIVRTNVPGAKARRLGPEFVEKLHTLFTSEDGDMLID